MVSGLYGEMLFGLENATLHMEIISVWVCARHSPTYTYYVCMCVEYSPHMRADENAGCGV